MNDPEGRIVCWSRMQAEAGQGLSNIVARKELERQAGSGQFFWGVGNPPSTAVASLAVAKRPVQAVFSIMKTPPKQHDVAPEKVRMWLRYIGVDGLSHPIPNHVLITSRVNSRKFHYALECSSTEALELADYGPFDQNAYRNVSGTGGKIGNSQVTALVREVDTPNEADYRINLQTQLTGGYWVKLTHPVELSSSQRSLVECFDPASGVSAWLKLIGELRNSLGHEVLKEQESVVEMQSSLFDEDLPSLNPSGR